MSSDFIPRRGKAQRLANTTDEMHTVIDGLMLFAADTGGLYFDLVDDKGALIRKQVTANSLVNYKLTGSGDIQISELPFDTVANKLDRVTPNQGGSDYDMTNNVVIIGPGGTIVDSGLALEDVGRGSTIIFSEVVLEAGMWQRDATQSVEVPNVLDDSIVIVSPKWPEEAVAYQIYCSAQADRLLTFKYIGSEPKLDITYNIVILGKSALEDNMVRTIQEGYLNPANWSDNGTLRVYEDIPSTIKQGSIITVSPINVEESLPYGVYASSQGEGFVEFKYNVKPDISLGYYLLIENLS